MSQSDLTLDENRPSPERVADLVRSLAVVMRQSDVTELDLQLGDVAIRLRRPHGGDTAENGLVVAADATTPLRETHPSHVVTAPMVGTFYASPTPSAPPFVSIGDHISAGQTVGIIEAMKIMNEISADRSGVVEELLVANAQPVEYGSPLVRLAIGREERL